MYRFLIRGEKKKKGGNGFAAVNVPRISEATMFRKRRKRETLFSLGEGEDFKPS